MRSVLALAIEDLWGCNLMNEYEVLVELLKEKDLQIKELQQQLEEALSSRDPEIRGVRKGPANLWWGIHNLIAHPLSEIVWWLGAKNLAAVIHDATLPEHTGNGGRG